MASASARFFNDIIHGRPNTFTPGDALNTSCSRREEREIEVASARVLPAGSPARGVVAKLLFDGGTDDYLYDVKIRRVTVVKARISKLKMAPVMPARGLVMRSRRIRKLSPSGAHDPEDGTSMKPYGAFNKAYSPREREAAMHAQCLS